MHRFHCPHLAAVVSEPDTGRYVDLDRDESHHAAKVLRLNVGELVELFDGAGLVAQGKIEALKPVARVCISSSGRIEPPLPVIDVATAIPKGPRADTMIEQLSQLGCDRVIPLRTARSVVDPRDAKLDRFTRAAMESAKQCGRAHLMRIEPVVDFGPALWRATGGIHLLASPAGRPLSELMDQIRQAGRVTVIVGPEGGFTSDEVREATATGSLEWSLGPHILRIETAAVAAVALLRGLLS